MPEQKGKLPPAQPFPEDFQRTVTQEDVIEIVPMQIEEVESLPPERRPRGPFKCQPKKKSPQRDVSETGQSSSSQYPQYSSQNKGKNYQPLSPTATPHERVEEFYSEQSDAPLGLLPWRRSPTSDKPPVCYEVERIHLYPYDSSPPWSPASPESSAPPMSPALPRPQSPKLSSPLYKRKLTDLHESILPENLQGRVKKESSQVENSGIARVPPSSTIMPWQLPGSEQGATPGISGSQMPPSPGSPSYSPVNSPGSPSYSPVNSPGSPSYRPASSPGSPSYRPVNSLGSHSYRPVNSPGSPSSRPVNSPGSPSYSPVNSPSSPSYSPLNSPGLACRSQYNADSDQD